MSKLARLSLLFLPFALLGAFFLLRCPPLWRDYDGLIQISSRPNDMTLLQYPPAYPAFSRLHIYAAQLLSRGRAGTKTAISLTKSVTLNDAGLRALLFSQQLALALAFGCFVHVCAPRGKASLWLLAFLLSNAALFLPAQLISTEALSQSLLVFFIAWGLWLVLAESLSAWSYACYGVLLLLLVLTRHANAVFAGIAPLALAGQGMQARWSTGAWLAAPWRRLAVLTVVGVMAIQAADGTTRGLCWVFQVKYRETGMRGPSEKLGFVELMPAEERAAFLAHLQSQAHDPIVQEAIPRLAQRTGWDRQRAEIETILWRLDPTAEKAALEARADHYLGLVVSAYYRSGSRYLIRETLGNIWWALAHTTPATISNYYFEDAVQSLELYPTQPWMAKLTQNLEACSPEAKARLQSLRQARWFWFWNWLPVGWALLLSSLAATALLIARRGCPTLHLYALATAMIGIIATVLTFVFVHFETRFASTANLLGFLSLAMVLANLRPERTRAPSS